MSSRALLLIDLQNDFCQGGSLAVPDGDSTIAIANNLIRYCKAQGYSILATQDWHPASHKSFISVQKHLPQIHTASQILWPDHCVQHTAGARLHPLLAEKEIDAIFYKGENPEIDSYSAFFDNDHQHKTALDDWLTVHQINELIIMGLATEYCVKFSVLDALSLGYSTTVITDGCRAINLTPLDSDQAWKEMEHAGAKLTTSAAYTAGSCSS